MKTLKVTNRSNGEVTYSLAELSVRRVFSIFETKNIPEAEMEALFQTDGGRELIKDFLLIHDEDWVNRHWEPTIEYFWTEKEIKECLLNDTTELFSETLDYAPEGVIDLIKFYAWKLPISDLNKINVISEKLGFDVQAAVVMMKEMVPEETSGQTKRLRQKKSEPQKDNNGRTSLDQKRRERTK